MVLEPGLSPFGLMVHAAVDPGREGVVRVGKSPHWLESVLVISLYGVMKSSGHELSFGFSKAQVSYLYTLKEDKTHNT